MKKFLIGLVTGLLLAALTLVLGIFALVRMAQTRPVVADGSTLVLRLQGPIPEKAPTDIPLPFFEEQSPSTVHEIWTALDRAATDKRIKALLLMPRGAGAGWGKLQEIREGILKFRKSGKPVVAWLSMPATRDYYLATAAEKVYMSPEDLLDLKGLRAEEMFIKGTLDKIGVKVDVEHDGKYMDYGDMFVRTSLSPASREVLNSILDGVYGTLIQTISESRKKTPEEVRALIDKGPFLARQARESGLVDDLLYEDQVLAGLRSNLQQQELKRISHRDYLKAVSPVFTRNRIALVVADGSILRGAGEDDVTSVTFTKLLRSVAADKSLAGVILRIDSPGGDAIASDEILREVKLLSERKPLVISMSDMAASGGYYIASSGDGIVAYPNTFTGSIGVVYGKLNLRGLYDKLGIQKEILTRGKFADVDSDYQPLSEAGRAKLREGLDQMYRSFVGHVAESRKRRFEEIELLAQGRVWLGSQARRNGLVDELGGLDKAIELVKAKAKIGRDEAVRLLPYPPRKSIFEKLLSRNVETLAEVRVQARLREVFGSFDPRLWLRGGLMKVVPYTIQIK